MRANRRREWISLVVFMLPTAALAQDMERLATNIYEQSIQPVPTVEAIKANLALLRPDGGYKDIDYASTVKAGWKPQTHLNRLNELANAWCDSKGPYHGDPTIKNALINGYHFWLDKDPQSTNWFFGVIAVPQRLGPLMLKMQQNGLLPEKDFAKGIAMVHRSAKGQGGASTGANLCSQAACTIREGILRYRFPRASESEKADAVALVRKSYDYIGSTLATALNLEDDGIRIDNSYQSHQQSLYDGGYGMTLIDRTTECASWGAGTGLGLKDAHVRRLVDYLLDGGPQWMVRGLTYDPLASGRYWSRVGHTNTAEGLKQPVDIALALCGEYRKGELVLLRERLADSIKNRTASSELGPTGNRMYWVSDYMSHHRPGFMMSVAGASTRTNTPESINGENLKAGYGTAGTHLIFQSGHEYDGIYAAWDWYRLPGTTSERSADGIGGSYSILPDHHFGKTELVGGATSGSIGAFVYKMDEYGITGNKCYFFFDRGMVALGNSIKQSTPNSLGGVVGTTLNQTLQNGPVVYSVMTGQTETIDAGHIVHPKNLLWVNHDSVGYFFLSQHTNPILQTQKQRGSWSAINTAAQHQSAQVNVFSLDLIHGNRPSDGSYAYAVMPNQSAAQTESVFASSPFTIIRNDTAVQAVRDNFSRSVSAVFYGRASIAVDKGMDLSLAENSAGTVVIWSRTTTVIKLSAANVTRRASKLIFTVSARLEGHGASYDPVNRSTTLTLPLPSGASAGSSVTATFNVVENAG